MSGAGCAKRTLGRVLVPWAAVLSFLLAVTMPAPVRAVYLDSGRNFSLRGQLYTEASVATEDSEPQTVTPIDAGDVISHRTFFNPEFDANLTPHLSFLGLDEIKFRMAIWGFYDGIYDYLDPKWRRTAQNMSSRFTYGRTSSAPFFPRNDTRYYGKNNPPRKVYTYQADPTLGHDGGPPSVADLPFRINEAYLNITKGRVSVRVGRQSISWGESDTIAILDQSNPFDLTRGVPGVLEEVDEARIPLWTLRTQLRLFDSWKAFSSGFLDAYLVPGSIDTTTSITPLPAGVSPYSPPEGDPGALINGFTAGDPNIQNVIDLIFGGIELTTYDRRPSRSMANSRYGFRFESIIDRNYTASVWFYRTLSQNPVPRFQTLDLSRTLLTDPSRPPGSGPAQIIVETGHGMVNVYGASLSFYSQLMNGIVRLNTQFFQDEPGFVPSKNLPIENLFRHPKLPAAFRGKPGPLHGFIPRADYLRWEIGFDRFFFNRVLNPSNSFVWITGLVGSWNVDETVTGRDYRFLGQRKPTGDSANPWKSGIDVGDPTQLDISSIKTNDKDYVDQKPVEWFIQSNLQTDYFHGRMSPRMTVIINPRGTYVINPSVVFRYSDRMLFTVKYAALMGGFFSSGFFRDRDQLSFRLTFLLN